MPLFKMTQSELTPLTATTFEAEGVRERADLQRLLRARIDAVVPDVMVVAEEYGDWDDSQRRIDLLGIDRAANLVVIELKRTQDGGHMELQALRYAAMVSSLPFEGLVAAHREYRSRVGLGGDAEAAILEFLGWAEVRPGAFASDVRIVLVSAAFSKELTTAVLWRLERDLDIRCVRVRPYRLGADMVLDVQQIVPLPEAADYQVQIRKRAQSERAAVDEQSLKRRFWTKLLERARTRTSLHAEIGPTDLNWVSVSSGIRGLQLNYFARQHDAQAELYIDRGTASDDENRQIFGALAAKKVEVETTFGGPIEWQDLPGKRACRIRAMVATGGYRSGEERWPEVHDAMIDTMIRFERALRPHIDLLKRSWSGR